MRIPLISALIVGLVACGGATPTLDLTPPTTPQPVTTQPDSTMSPPATPPQTVATLPAAATSTTMSITQATTAGRDDPETTTTTGSSPMATLPGSPIDLGWPAPGDVLAVVGVAHDDVLNLREGPGADQVILATLSPTTADVVATGRSRSLPKSIWHEVSVDNKTGWVSGAFLAYSGATYDVTAVIVSEMGRPSADSMEELGRLVAIQAGGGELSRVTQTAASSPAGGVTFDIIGSGDDSVRGIRLVVFGEPVAGGYSLRSVEQTVFCGRDVSEDGYCV